jgi:hypothetical protein
VRDLQKFASTAPHHTPAADNYGFGCCCFSIYSKNGFFFSNLITSNVELLRAASFATRLSDGSKSGRKSKMAGQTQSNLLLPDKRE